MKSFAGKFNNSSHGDIIDVHVNAIVVSSLFFVIVVAILSNLI